jgi:Mg2+/Co2+ transporter CorC
MSANRFLRPGRVLSPRERDRYRNELKDIQTRIEGNLSIPQNAAQRNGEGMPSRKLGYLSQFLDKGIKENKRILEDRKKRLTAVLSAGSPDSLGRAARSSLEKRADQLKEQLRKVMVPRKFHKVRSVDDRSTFDKTVKAVLKTHSPEFRNRAAEYKKIMRELHPDDPAAANLERIRPK